MNKTECLNNSKSLMNTHLNEFYIRCFAAQNISLKLIKNN